MRLLVAFAVIGTVVSHIAGVGEAAAVGTILGAILGAVISVSRHESNPRVETERKAKDKAERTARKKAETKSKRKEEVKLKEEIERKNSAKLPDQSRFAGLPKLNAPAGYTYIIQDVSSTNRYKIGHTTDPVKRIQEIQNNEVGIGTLMYVHVITANDPKKLKQYLYQRYANKKSKGAYREWFDLREEQIQEILSIDEHKIEAERQAEAERENDAIRRLVDERKARNPTANDNINGEKTEAAKLPGLNVSHLSYRTLPNMEPPAGYVYIVKDVSTTSNYMIAQADQTSHLRDIFPYNIEIIAILMWTNAVALESCLHHRYASTRRHGKWFDLDCDHLQEIRDIPKHVVAIPTRRYEKLPKLPDPFGYVYFIQDVEFSKLYKIGLTNSPSDRMNSFGVQLPFRTEIKAIFLTTDDRKLEKRLHQQYASKRIRGEWFDLTDAHVYEIRSL